jgi:hypothetical protein
VITTFPVKLLEKSEVIANLGADDAEIGLMTREQYWSCWSSVFEKAIVCGGENCLENL